MSCQELKFGCTKSSYVAKTRKAAPDQRWLALVTGNIAGGFLSHYSHELAEGQRSKEHAPIDTCDKQFHWDLYLCLHGSNVYVSHHHSAVQLFSLATAQLTVSWNVENVFLHSVTRKCIILDSPSSFSYLKINACLKRHFRIVHLLAFC